MPSRPSTPSRASILGAVVGAVCLLTVAVALSPGTSATAAASPAQAPPTTVEGMDADLRMNQVQTVGTHNSYHRAPPSWLLNLASTFIADAAQAAEWKYTHSSVADQLEHENVRQFEFDIYADSEGGRFARPALRLLGAPFNGPHTQPEMDEPGFKVLHVADLDFLSTCWTFVSCIQQVETWSSSHPGHLPVMILVEAKGYSDAPEVIATEIEPIDAAALDAIDAEIRSVFDEDRLLTPDDIRGSYPDVRTATQAEGWPRLGDVAGRVMFVLDQAGQAGTYATGHPGLAGRVMFTNTTSSGFRNLWNTTNEASIRNAVEDGYLVRARAGQNQAVTAIRGDTVGREAALDGGAHWVSTDFPASGPALADFGIDYFVTIPGGGVARCNPVSGADVCTPPPVTEPIVFVHDHRGNRSAWNVMERRFFLAGFPRNQMFAFSYDSNQPFETSADQLDQFVARVRARTGAAKVDLVTHGTGGLLSRWYLRFDGGAAEVDDWVSMGGPNLGDADSTWCSPATCDDLDAGSDFLEDLNDLDATWGDVNYATLRSSCDSTVDPASVEFPYGARIVRSHSSAGTTNGAFPCISHGGFRVDAAVFDAVYARVVEDR